MPTLSSEQWELLRQAALEMATSLGVVEETLKRELQVYSAPPEMKEFTIQLTALNDVLKRPPPAGRPGGVADHLNRVLKTVVLWRRRELATNLDHARDKTAHASLRASFDEMLKPFEDLIAEEWMSKTDTLRIPRVADFLTLESTEVHLGVGLPERQYDEKFHLLQAPSRLMPDVHYFRLMCDLRGKSVTLAYLDIDDFKAINLHHGESAVDLNVLPTFMRALEAAVFARGYAYRYGGDEYAILLPNADEDAAVLTLESIRMAVQNLTYRGVDEHTTVSIGMCCLPPDCFLTDREAESRANAAKNFAKEHGKNRIASYRGSLFRPDDLFIVTP